ncbi:ubiquinol-cytochrome-c reductase complex assembly factor 3 [Suncus etruscus]|uniref:ubiquinol-cytochrome-c reductase complex assembly factor 3 n=1 Tax=Suncus etruscus TaxID=109475 RepID=UPI00210F48F3|nr:ubiquinol-cytochrome-c reductase complex assembly factor 3 [Suncus etruscus]
MALRKALILGALMGTGAGVGSTLFVLVTPGEQRKQRMLQEMPEQSAQHRDETTKINAMVLATLQEAAATQENVAFKKNWLGGR